MHKNVPFLHHPVYHILKQILRGWLQKLLK